MTFMCGGALRNAHECSGKHRKGILTYMDNKSEGYLSVSI